MRYCQVRHPSPAQRCCRPCKWCMLKTTAITKVGAAQLQVPSVPDRHQSRAAVKPNKVSGLHPGSSQLIQLRHRGCITLSELHIDVSTACLFPQQGQLTFDTGHDRMWMNTGVRKSDVAPVDACDADGYNKSKFPHTQFLVLALSLLLSYY